MLRLEVHVAAIKKLCRLVMWCIEPDLVSTIEEKKHLVDLE